MILPVDSAKVLANGTVRPDQADRLLKEILIQLTPNDQIMKGALAQLDVLASNKWERPIYYTSGVDQTLGLQRYYRSEGLAYRVVPIETSYKSLIEMGEIDTDTLYQRIMHTFTWGRMNQEDVHLDYYTIRNLSVIRFRNLHTRLALKLLEEGKREKAIEVLDRCMELAPSSVLPFDTYVSGITLPGRDGGVIHHEGIIEAYYMCGETEKANTILKEYYEEVVAIYNYYNSMKLRHRNSIQRETNEAVYQMEEMKLLLQKFNQQELMLELGISDRNDPLLPG
jgi:hypothetical protein